MSVDSDQRPPTSMCLSAPATTQFSVTLDRYLYTYVRAYWQYDNVMRIVYGITDDNTHTVKTWALILTTYELKEVRRSLGVVVRVVWSTDSYTYACTWFILVCNIYQKEEDLPPPPTDAELNKPVSSHGASEVVGGRPPAGTGPPGSDGGHPAGGPPNKYSIVRQHVCIMYMVT